MDSFLRTFYSSSSCNTDLLEASLRNLRDFDVRTSRTTIFNVIEMEQAVPISSFLCESNTVDCSEPISRINIIVPSWCTSTCGKQGMNLKS